MQIIQIFNDYINYIKTKRVETTVITYKNKFNMAEKCLKVTDTEVLTKEVAQQLIDNLAEKYSTKTVRSIYDVINAAFRLAHSNGVIKENPFLDCNVKKVIHHEAVILSDKQVATLMESCKYNQALFIPIIIAIKTGLRRSQVLSLQWKDVLFDESKILVEKNLIHAKSRKFTEGKEHQKRYIEMPNELSLILFEVKNHRRSIGVGTGQEDFVCLTNTYKVLEPTYFNKIFRKFINDLEDIPDNFRFHDLRWKFIKNEIIDKNENPKKVACKVGHKSCLYTLDYYCKYIA